jgi:hypothetical protein
MLNAVEFEPEPPTVIVYAPGDVVTGTDGLYATPPAPPPAPVYDAPPPPPATIKVSREVNDGLVTVKVPEPLKV